MALTFKKEIVPKLKGVELIELVPFPAKEEVKTIEYFTFSVFAEIDTFLFEVGMN